MVLTGELAGVETSFGELTIERDCSGVYGLIVPISWEPARKKCLSDSKVRGLNL